MVSNPSKITMAKINDQTLVDWLVENNKYSSDKAWSVVMSLLEKDKGEKQDTAPRRRAEWLVVTHDPLEKVPDGLVGFVVQKRPIKKDANFEDTEEERMWGDLEVDDLLEHAFQRTEENVKGIPTFLNRLRAAKKLLKEEYGFDIKSKEGCYITPSRTILACDEDDPDYDEDDFV